jgi:CheY-like chemotaxis protein
MTHAPKAALVLVVEDEALIRMVAVDALSDAGYEVLEAEHAAAALIHLAGRADDVVIVCTDVHMPGGMDGIRLAHHVVAHWPWIGLVVMSGQARPASGELPNKARFLAKPYETDTLVAHVAEMVGA